MSAEARIIRRHVCTVCGKSWHCLAENPGRNKDGRPSRPIVACVYPGLLACPPCHREGRHA